MELVKRTWPRFMLIAVSLLAVAAAPSASPLPTNAPIETQPPLQPSTAPVPKKANKKKTSDPKRASATQPTASGTGAVAETTKIEPIFTYRYGALQADRESVYHQDEHVDAADQLYASLRFAKTYDYVHHVMVEPALRTLRNNPVEKEIIFEQAYIESQTWPEVHLTAGKKTEYNGAGFVINPSDLLNEDKDIFDNLYQREGKVFSRIRWQRSAFSLGLGYIPFRANPANKGKAWISAAGQLAVVDLRLQATHQKNDKTTTGLSASRFFGEHVELHFDGRYQARQRDPTEIASVDYLDYSSYRRHEASGFYLIGTRLVLTARRTIILEAIQQQSGLLPEQFDAYFLKVKERTKTPDPPVMIRGRHYLFASYQDDDSLPRTHFSVSYLANIDDQSAFASATLAYTLSPITSLELTPTMFSGARHSEFGEMPFDSATYFVFKGRF